MTGATLLLDLLAHPRFRGLWRVRRRDETRWTVSYLDADRFDGETEEFEQWADAVRAAVEEIDS